METVVACGVIRQAAELIRDGADVDSAIRQSTKGISNAVRESVLQRIAAATPALRRKITPDDVRKAVLSAAANLDH